MCRRMGLTFPQYMLIKEAILRESVRLGRLSKSFVVKMFKIDGGIVERVFDHLVSEEEIIMDEREA